MANSYKKPLVLANEELAEGVYAASGDDNNEPNKDGVVVTDVKLTTPGNEYYKVHVFTVTIHNYGNTAVKDWKATVNVTSGVATNAQVYNGDLASASLSGTAITITPGAGGGIPANGSINVEVVVSFSSSDVKLGA